MVRVWLVGLAPMAVVFGCLAILLRTPAEQRSRAAPFRTLASCLLGLLISTVIVAQSSTLGQVFQVAGGSFLWEFVLFWQWAITVLCGLAAWAIAREVMTLRTAVRAFAGGVAAIALAIRGLDRDCHRAPRSHRVVEWRGAGSRAVRGLRSGAAAAAGCRLGRRTRNMARVQRRIRTAGPFRGSGSD